MCAPEPAHGIGPSSSSLTVPEPPEGEAPGGHSPVGRLVCEPGVLSITTAASLSLRATAEPDASHASVRGHTPEGNREATGRMRLNHDTTCHTWQDQHSEHRGHWEQ